MNEEYTPDKKKAKDMIMKGYAIKDIAKETGHTAIEVKELSEKIYQ